jgi:opacity protein-like surface antigen
VAADAVATSAVKVVRDRATVWTRSPSLVLAVVPAGTVLRAVSRDDKWYEVDVPASLAARQDLTTGFILAVHVEPVPGTPPPPVRAPRATESQWDPVGPGSAAGPAAGPNPPVAAPAIGIRGFGALDYMFFSANDSFEAIFGSSSHPLYGGGAEVVFGGRFYVGGSIERFHKTGQRVFVSGGEVFELGIDDAVTITPITFTAGYRLRPSEGFVPYVGGGAGVYRFKEESQFAEAGEDVDESFTSYHALVGVEYAASRWLFGGFEVRYTAVPDALGAPGVSSEFDESNLGGLSLRFKVSVGR